MLPAETPALSTRKVTAALCQQNRDEGVQRQAAWPDTTASPHPGSSTVQTSAARVRVFSLIFYFVDFYREQKCKSDPRYPVLVTSPFTLHSNQLLATLPAHGPVPINPGTPVPGIDTCQPTQRAHTGLS